jgi:hypothetical protein
MGKVPNLGSFPNFTGHIYIRGRMDKKAPFYKGPRFLALFEKIGVGRTD